MIQNSILFITTKMRNILLIILLSFGWVFTPSYAQDVISDMSADSYALYYYRDRTDIQEDYMDNSVQMARIRHILLHSTRIDSITIYSYSSPEGTPRRNNYLARKRAEVAKDFILSNCAEGILSAENIHLRPMGENWEGLYEELRLNYHHPNRDRVLRIMRANVSTETKKWRLQNLDDGYTYKLIIREHMPALRMATWICVHNAIMPLALDTTFAESDVALASASMPRDIVMSLDSTLLNDKPFIWALKTNLLYDALLVPNIGAEFHLGRNYSVAANLHFAWWNTKSWYWRTYGGELAVRKWFGKAAKRKPLTGHHLGIYGQVLTYDFLAFGNKGYMSGEPYDNIFDRPVYSVGVEYGYSLPITRRLNLDFVIGVGYQTSKFNEYRLIGDCYVWQALRNRTFIGPTKAEVTLVWLLGKDNMNFDKKGGRR